MPQAPRGTRDFAPDETAIRQHVAQRMRAVFHRFGYREVQTPTFEELELFTAKSGEGIIKELYDFTDKGDRRMCLRPELTAPVMRMVYQDHAFDPKPLKWYYFGNCFRYDRPQKGRYREFWQFGCEQVGAGGPLAYAELIALADALLQEVGLGDLELNIGHVGLLRELVDALGIEGEPRMEVMRLIDKRDDETLRKRLREHNCPDEVTDRLFAAMDAPDIEAARNLIDDQDALAGLEAVFGHLEAMGVNHARLDLGIARGLDYYTDLVFEVHCPSLGAEKQLLGGGGYDLSGIFDAQPMPTMGFGLGFDRTLVALETQNKTPQIQEGPDIYLGALGDQATTYIAQLARQLRDQGIAVDMDLMGRKPGQIAKAADAAGAQRLIIIGDRDLESGQVRVKNLASGEQEEVALEDLATTLKTIPRR